MLIVQGSGRPEVTQSVDEAGLILRIEDATRPGWSILLHISRDRLSLILAEAEWLKVLSEDATRQNGTYRPQETQR